MNDTQNQIVVETDLKKVMLTTTFAIIGIALVCVAIFMFIERMDVIDNMSIAFDALGITIGKPGFISFAVLGGVIVCAYVFMYIKYNRHMTFAEESVMTPVNEQISYKNITRVIYRVDSIPNELLKCGTIVVEAGGVSKPSFEVMYVSDVENKTKKIQDMIYRFKIADYQKQQQQGNINKIIEQW